MRTTDSKGNYLYIGDWVYVRSSDEFSEIFSILENHDESTQYPIYLDCPCGGVDGYEVERVLVDQVLYRDVLNKMIETYSKE